ncbi:MAG TPA: iron-sulfur cluster assembly accessory protein [Thermoanaerobaculia bacterium]|nr:iron-sulfur cluster assembly accessory protein [Thermoanaerobaculia bacterium]
MEPNPDTRPDPAELPAEPATPVELTAKAVEMIKLTRDQEGMDASWGLRVAVMGGGCSGFQYALDFEQEARETDAVMELDGLRVYVDPVSARYLEGVVIDYVFGMNGAGFKFQNPRATGTCGCGSSFAV